MVVRLITSLFVLLLVNGSLATNEIETNQENILNSMSKKSFKERAKGHPLALDMPLNLILNESSPPSKRHLSTQTEYAPVVDDFQPVFCCVPS